MRRLGCLLSFASCLACATDPDYASGQGGSSGAAGATATAGTTGMAGTTGTAGTSGGGGTYMPPALTIAHPNPIISRGKMVFASPAANAAAVVNGQYHNGGWNAGRPTEAAPAWVAIKLDPGPKRILVSWDDGGTYDYQPLRGATDVPTYGLPAAYRLEVSTDSTNGMDGTWTMAGAPVTGNVFRTRAHAIDFHGKAWIRMFVTGTPARSNGVVISEIDVHDISATPTGLPEDTWFFMGDSITAFAYQRATFQQPSFAAGINAAVPAYFPAMINGGVGSENTRDALNRLDQVLAANDAYRFFALGYGTNDCAGDQMNTAAFRDNMQMLIDRIKAAGRIPILAHIPYAGDGSHDTAPLFNAVIDELTRENGLQVGPDFYRHFMDHPNELQSDKLHPNNDGQKAMNPLWTAAARPLYPSP
jgi:acyl-CoA thioesterase I